MRQVRVELCKKMKLSKVAARARGLGESQCPHSLSTAGHRLTDGRVDVPGLPGPPCFWGGL